MPHFKIFQTKIAKQFDRMQKHPLYRSSVDKETAWNTYLASFPAGTNPLYKERNEYDCNVCKGFIRAVGNVVAIVDGKVESIWDVEIDDPAYKAVAGKMAELMKSRAIENIFLHTEPEAGKNQTFRKPETGAVITYNHFHLDIPRANQVAGDDIGPRLSQSRATKDVMLRSLKELTPDSVSTVLEMIAQNSLYRGEEHKFAVDAFQKLQTKFSKLKTDEERDIFCWSMLKAAPEAVLRIRNTAIGTLLTDISEGKELDEAVAAFESKVAPTNYKRPTAVVTKGMIAKAQKAIEDLGYAPALERRFATIEDITVNNILFADRSAKKKLKGNVFDDIALGVKEHPKKFDKVEEIGIDDFIQNVLPKAEGLEVMLENRHGSNLMSLVAPVDAHAKGMFKWDNNFSWSYTGEMADSIKERVKKAGGKVDGDVRCSLSWFNYDDLDLHMYEPGGYHINFTNRGSDSPSKGKLDVDMNAGAGSTRNAVENICYLDRKYMREGVYTLKVHNYSRRETIDLGFAVEIEFDGETRTISYDKAVQQGENIEVAQIKYSKGKGFEIIKSLPSTATSREMWGLPSQAFHKASVVMLSPNYWDEKHVGNKHYFFMLEGAHNDGKARGFFNEFLSEELAAHRKVLEIVGAKMKTEKSDNQLSGLGFSSTQRNHVLCKVKGNFTRTVKVVF